MDIDYTVCLLGDLGVLISQDLSFTNHILGITTKANKMLGFIKRNLRHSPKHLREVAYFSLVRSKLDYCASIWDPSNAADIKTVEKIQRKSAHFVKNIPWHRRQISVNELIKDLDWETLEKRRQNMRLILMYKIQNNLVQGIDSESHLVINENNTRAGYSGKCYIQKHNNKKNYTRFILLKDNKRLEQTTRKH